MDPQMFPFNYAIYQPIYITDTQRPMACSYANGSGVIFYSSTQAIFNFHGTGATALRLDSGGEYRSSAAERVL